MPLQPSPSNEVVIFRDAAEALMLFLQLLSTISDIIFLQFTVFPCKADLSQVKRNLKFSIINYVYKLPHELPNDLRLRIFGKENFRKSQNWMETG